MIDSKDFFVVLKLEEISPFVGVPCSLIKSLIAYAVDHPEEVDYVNPTHESHAMAYAAGSYMASGKLPMVFLQNSGFGNIINPLTSLHQIYDIPAILLITWRSEDGYGTDAPEHWIVGRDMEAYFDAFHLPYRIPTAESWKKDLQEMKQTAFETKKPVILCIRKGMFAPYSMKKKLAEGFEMTSAEAIAAIKKGLPESVFLSTTGMISRESFAADPSPDFYMMGSMGLIAGIAAGCAEHSEKRVVAFDGDGAVLMHMGLVPFIASRKLGNLVHVVIDNEAYSSTDGQPTVSPVLDFVAVVKASGYPQAMSMKTKSELSAALKKIPAMIGPVLLHVKVQSGNDHHIGRISDKYTCAEVTENFMKKLRE